MGFLTAVWSSATFWCIVLFLQDSDTEMPKKKKTARVVESDEENEGGGGEEVEAGSASDW